MKRAGQIAALACAMGLGSPAIAEEIRLPNLQSEEEFAAEMPINRKIKTLFGSVMETIRNSPGDGHR